MKIGLDKIFKNGNNFKLKEIDFSSSKVRHSFKQVKKEQEKALERKRVDWVKLNSFVIEI